MTNARFVIVLKLSVKTIYDTYIIHNMNYTLCTGWSAEDSYGWFVCPTLMKSALFIDPSDRAGVLSIVKTNFTYQKRLVYLCLAVLYAIEYYICLPLAKCSRLYVPLNKVTFLYIWLWSSLKWQKLAVLKI